MHIHINSLKNPKKLKNYRKMTSASGNSGCPEYVKCDIDESISFNFIVEGNMNMSFPQKSKSQIVSYANNNGQVMKYQPP